MVPKLMKNKSAWTPAAYTIVGILGTIILAFLCRTPGFNEKLLAISNGAWNDAIFDGIYPANRSLRAIIEILISLTLAYPIFFILSKKNELPKNASSQALLIVALLAGTLLRLDIWWTKPYWIDAYALKAGLRTHSFIEILSSPLGFGQSAPIGFCVIEKMIGELSNWNDKALTFPILLVGLATLYMFPLVLKKANVISLQPYLTLLIAISPALVYYSGEFKQYGFDAFFALLSFYAALKIKKDEKPTLLLILAFIVGPLFSHTQFFIIPGLGLLLFLDTFRYNKTWCIPSRKDTILFATCLFLGGLATITSYLHTVATMPDMMFDFWAFAFPPRTSIKAFIGWFAQNGLRFFYTPFSILPVPETISWIKGLLYLPVPILIVIGALFKNSQIRKATLVLIITILLMSFASIIQKWPICTGENSTIYSRHLLYLLPPAFLFLAIGLERAYKQIPVIAIAVVLIAVPTGISHILSDKIYSWSLPEAITELQNRAGHKTTILLGGYHTWTACAYMPEWLEENKSRITVLSTKEPEAFSARLDELAASPTEDFWILWMPRGLEGRLVPMLCGEKLKGRKANFVKKTKAGNLQHFPGIKDAD